MNLLASLIFSQNGRKCGVNKTDYNIFSGDKFLESLRSGGYKNTSYAIAELVDNSIDAGAKNIEILCQDKINPATNHSVLDEIGLLDDGHGMNQEELRRSLLFGDGNRGSNAKDIGRYGMGLPNSSLSQCTKVEVYSWQNSSDPLYSYIDLDEVKKGQKEIPVPEIKKIPDMWKKIAEHFPKKSGTLIIWSNLDRCSWTTSRKIMEHSEYLIGRLYRNFLSKNIIINMKSFREDKDNIVDESSRQIRSNDPLYLMTHTSTPGKWENEPMFKPDVSPETEYIINYDGKQHCITVRYSIVKDEVRDPENNTGEPGSTSHGKHAKRNIGVSIVRAGREIEMNTSLVQDYDPIERWWGIEINLPTSLDLAVGLTNNKQHTTELSEIMDLRKRFEGDSEGIKQIDDDLERTTNRELYRMINEIFAHKRSMIKRLSASREGTRKNKLKTPLDSKIEGAIQQGEGDGDKGQTEKDIEQMSNEQRTELIKDRLISDGIGEEEAEESAINWIKEDKKAVFKTVELEGSQFFSIENIGGILLLKINSNHRAYKNLLSLTEDDKHKELDCKKRLQLTNDGLWLLLTSWARFEDLIKNKDHREKVQDIRFEWGKELNRFLEQNEP